MTSNFELESCKWIFRLEDMTFKEQQMWINRLRDDGLKIDNPNEIFKPFDGEQSIHLNEDVGTQELRVRVWNWVDLKNTNHKILDINAWPGDNESGIIAIDGTPVISNSDQDLSWIDGVSDIYGFDDCLEYFTDIRPILMDDDYDIDNENQHNFFVSESRIKSRQIENQAWENYKVKINEINNRINYLRNKYLHEFTLTIKLPTRSSVEDVIKVAEQIGYQLKTNFFGEVDERTTFTFINWDNYYNLVTIDELYDTNTYILNSWGMIDKLIYKKHYLPDDYDPQDKLSRKLAKRIHSYYEVKINRGMFLLGTVH